MGLVSLSIDLLLKFLASSTSSISFYIYIIHFSILPSFPC